MLLDHDVATSALADMDVRSNFVGWVATQCLKISQKRNRLALYHSLLVKSGGASQSVLSHMKKTHG